MAVGTQYCDKPINKEEQTSCGSMTKQKKNMMSKKLIPSLHRNSIKNVKQILALALFLFWVRFFN